MDTCPTVKVCADNDQGFIIINEQDFDATRHVLAGDKPADRNPGGKAGRHKPGDSK